ncbi:MAG: phytanoyl-CoA dioxygenase [Phycisphaeraceae bacterium]|nr:phytanoyl-CoA dioxygenase [Phycisphaeraceae bacterium]
MTDLISDSQRAQFDEDGFTVLERVIPDDQLVLLREQCAYFHGYVDGEMDVRGVTQSGITHRGSRYFISRRYRMSSCLWRFIFSPLMAEITSAVLGPDVYLFNEQWVLKGADHGMKFSWHQDSGYVRTRDRETRHRPYLSCWCALDDVDERNGTVYLLPHEQGGTRDTIHDHVEEPDTKDLVGYQGDEPGVPVVAPAGSIAVFSSFCLHRSGANLTDRMRRVYLMQYSAEVLRHSNGELWNYAVPFVRDDRVVYDHDSDVDKPDEAAAVIPK